MAKQKMSVQRALERLKLYENKIERATQNAVFVQVSTEGKIVSSGSKSTGKTVEEFKKNADASFQSIKALIANRDALKSAIIVSNATTEITVAGKTMTVAEAIYRKEVMDTNRTLIYSYESAKSQAYATYDRLSKKADTAYENERAQVITNFSSADKTKDSALVDAMLESVEKRYKASYPEVVLGDVATEEAFEKLDAEYSEFISEINYLLTESNVRTEIEVDLAKED